jgi:hypothetical protein
MYESDLVGGFPDKFIIGGIVLMLVLQPIIMSYFIKIQLINLHRILLFSFFKKEMKRKII